MILRVLRFSLLCQILKYNWPTLLYTVNNMIYEKSYSKIIQSIELLAKFVSQTMFRTIVNKNLTIFFAK